MIAKKLLTTVLAGMCCLTAAGIVVYAAEDTMDTVLVLEAGTANNDIPADAKRALEVNEDATDSKVMDAKVDEKDVEETSDKVEEEDKNKDSKEEDKKEEDKEVDNKDKEEDKKDDSKDDEADTKNTEKEETTSKKAKTVKTAAVTKKTVKTYTKADLKLLSCLIFAESGNQPYQGKLAVANVVLNRVKSSKYPNTMKAVIYQRGQFSVARNGMLSRELSKYSNYTGTAQKECIKAAKAALEGENNIGGYLFFTRYTKSLESRYKNGRKIGDHYFR